MYTYRRSFTIIILLIVLLGVSLSAILWHYYLKTRHSKTAPVRGGFIELSEAPKIIDTILERYWFAKLNETRYTILIHYYYRARSLELHMGKDAANNSSIPVNYLMRKYKSWFHGVLESLVFNCNSFKEAASARGLPEPNCSVAYYDPARESVLIYVGSIVSYPMGEYCLFPFYFNGLIYVDPVKIVIVGAVPQICQWPPGRPMLNGRPLYYWVGTESLCNVSGADNSRGTLVPPINVCGIVGPATPDNIFNHTYIFIATYDRSVWEWYRDQLYYPYLRYVVEEVGARLLASGRRFEMYNPRNLPLGPVKPSPSTNISDYEPSLLLWVPDLNLSDPLDRGVRNGLLERFWSTVMWPLLRDLGVEVDDYEEFLLAALTGQADLVKLGP